ncbi:MAG: type I pullulanase [Bacteroidales bacterium]
MPYYDGNDLGVSYSPEKTTIKVWAPSASKIELRLFNKELYDEPIFIENLTGQDKGIWCIEIDRDLEGMYYDLVVKNGKWHKETLDIYAKAVGTNGRRGQIIDLQKTSPEGWSEDKGPLVDSINNCIIYETHVRDFSIDESSGIEHKGLFIGVSEEGTKTPKGATSGLDHILELGITHLHLLPIFDFKSIDERFSNEQYNWGYDPKNFNVPEGSYSTDHKDGSTRIRELKQMIKTLHDKGIGVVMDVVYNHTGYSDHSVFNLIEPGYFYRHWDNGTLSNGSGCGNEVASERPMVRKFIIDSIRYWASEFHIDGFRFDLMGLIDLETMREVRRCVDTINPNIIIYGEGWTADKTPLPKEYQASKYNVGLLDRVSVFNDNFRDAIKGRPNPNELGFVSGNKSIEEPIKFGIVGATYHPQLSFGYINSPAYAQTPCQTISYMSCHDNYTIYDQLKIQLPKEDDSKLAQRIKLAMATIMMSQGVPFIHAGTELLRSKQGVENSYRSPDSINKIDWNRKDTFPEVTEYLKNIIQLRKNHPAFRIRKIEELQRNLSFNGFHIPGVVAFYLLNNTNKDSWRSILVILNNNETPIKIPVSNGTWQLMVECDTFFVESNARLINDEIEIQPISMTLLKQN